jgi:hypothetical protein
LDLLFVALGIESQDLEDGRVSKKTDDFAMDIVLIELLTGMDCEDARALVESEGATNISAAACAMARGLHVGMAGPEDGTMEAAQVLGKVAASFIAGVKQRKSLQRVEAAHARIVAAPPPPGHSGPRSKRPQRPGATTRA